MSQPLNPEQLLQELQTLLPKSTPSERQKLLSQAAALILSHYPSEVPHHIEQTLFQLGEQYGNL